MKDGGLAITTAALTSYDVDWVAWMVDGDYIQPDADDNLSETIVSFANFSI